jgi:methionyl-tRNA formyltransferase
MNLPARTVFLGSGEFALAPAAALLEHHAVDLVAVVTAPPRPAGRRAEVSPTPIGGWAEQHALPTLTPGRLRGPEALAALAGLRPDLLVLADYGQLVPAAVLGLPRHGALNLHPSLLPRHRGAAPIQAAIIEGDDATGVTLMVMDEGLDSGPIVAQRRLLLRGDEVAPELERRLSEIAAGLLSESLEPWLRGEREAVPQAAEGMTMTRLLRREDGRLDPTRPAVHLERQVRALQPWPGSLVDTAAGRLTVWRAAVVPGTAGDTVAAAGDLVMVGDIAPGLVTSDGVLELLEVQPAGGRRMSGADWLRGRSGALASASSAVRR